VQDNGFINDAMPENQWLLDSIKPELMNLYKYQELAAKEAGFDTMMEERDPGRIKGAEDMLGNQLQTLYGMQYLDTANIPTAVDADELSQQFAYIRQLDSRTDTQKRYLQSRSAVRYWMGQINQRGGDTGLQELQGMLNTDMTSFYGKTGMANMPISTMGSDVPNLFAATAMNTQPAWSLVSENTFLPGEIDSSVFDQYNHDSNENDSYWKEYWNPQEYEPQTTGGWSADMIEGDMVGDEMADFFGWETDDEEEPDTTPDKKPITSATSDRDWEQQFLVPENVAIANAAIGLDPYGNPLQPETPDTTPVDPNDGKWVPPSLPSNNDTSSADINQHTGHAQVPHDNTGVMTEEYLQHVVQTGGFRALEMGLGLSMPEIYKHYALGRFSWQTGTTIPEWLQPNLTSIYGGADKYAGLIDDYEHNPEMMRRLERVETATRAPYVMNYLDDTHGEMHSIYHDGGISHDEMSQITGQKMPDFAYNSAGHVVLRDDRTISHDPGSNIHVVNYVSPAGKVTEHTQMDFGVEPEAPVPVTSNK